MTEDACCWRRIEELEKEIAGYLGKFKMLQSERQSIIAEYEKKLQTAMEALEQLTKKRLCQQCDEGTENKPCTCLINSMINRVGKDALEKMRDEVIKR